MVYILNYLLRSSTFFYCAVTIYIPFILFRSAVYKARKTGTGNGIRGTRGMFTRIPGNLFHDSRECYYFKIPENVEKDSGECSRGFQGMLKKIPGNVEIDSGACSRRLQGMLKKIPGNVRKDSTECSRRFRGMLEKIPGNLTLDLFCEILLILHQILQLNCNRTRNISYASTYCL